MVVFNFSTIFNYVVVVGCSVWYVGKDLHAEKRRLKKRL